MYECNLNLQRVLIDLETNFKQLRMKKYLMLIFILVVISCGSESKIDQLKNHAGIISIDFVKDKLKDPSAANFPTFDRVVEEIGENTFKVISYVDAKNSFGAQSKTYYRVVLKYNGGEWAKQSNWELVSIEFE